MVTLGYTLNFYRFCNHSNCHARSHGQVAHCLTESCVDSRKSHIKSSSNSISFCHFFKHGLKYFL